MGTITETEKAVFAEALPAVGTVSHLDNANPEGLPRTVAPQFATANFTDLPSPFSENSLTVHVRKVLPADETKILLRRRGVPKLQGLRTASVEEKIAALAFIPYLHG